MELIKQSSQGSGHCLGTVGSAQGMDGQEEAGEMDVSSWSHGTLNPSNFLLQNGYYYCKT